MGRQENKRGKERRGRRETRREKQQIQMGAGSKRETSATGGSGEPQRRPPEKGWHGTTAAQRKLNARCNHLGPARASSLRQAHGAAGAGRRFQAGVSGPLPPSASMWLPRAPEHHTPPEQNRLTHTLWVIFVLRFLKPAFFII